MQLDTQAAVSAEWQTRRRDASRHHGVEYSRTGRCSAEPATDGVTITGTITVTVIRTITVTITITGAVTITVTGWCR